MKLRVLDLFSGIGGFSLGLERAKGNGEYVGFKTVAFCEIEEFPRKVLARHWPDVPCYTDVRELTGERLAADGIAVDAICGGFPCQDISFAGKGAGLAGERSGLFYQVARLIGELGPAFVILENVGALLSRGLDAVLGTLASLGYDAEWHCIPASTLGAPHQRDRIWIVAYASLCGQRPHCGSGKDTGAQGASEGKGHQWQRLRAIAGGGGEALANSYRTQRQGNERPIGIVAEYADFGRASWWGAEPAVGRVANGVPDRAHRLKALGNAVVPQIPELIGNAILSSLNERSLAA